ncbi:MAG: hypothetical protein H6765_02330 [Candidatus Peribacteria bacterium]|nr:MAG: hypothetical protein H6765_02330 [Candidatus Peribacteria bacterium]
MFAEKIKDVEKFHIKGIVQVFFDGIYVASMIGKVSVLIFRDHKLNYSLANYTQETGKIDLFTEFVEGDVNEDDEIVTIGIPVDTYLDRDDYAAVVQMSRTTDASLIESLIEVL